MNFFEPKFGKVFDIIVFEECVLLCVHEYIGSYFCAHYNGFVIKQTAYQLAIDINSLVDHRPLHARHSFDKNDTDYYVCTCLPLLYVKLNVATITVVIRTIALVILSNDARFNHIMVFVS